MLLDNVSVPFRERGEMAGTLIERTASCVLSSRGPMNKRFLATATAAIAVAPVALAVGVLGASPAGAVGVNCDNVYPAGQAYQLRLSPTYALIKPGSRVTISTRLLRGGQQCNGETVSYYTKNKGVTVYSNSRNLTTKDIGKRGGGLIDASFLPPTDFRVFARATGSRSPAGLVQYRR